MKSHVRELAIRRTGGVYIAVLGTALIVSVLGLTTMFLHRAQNRMLVESADIRQAQLNAESAAQLALLTIKNNASWRTSEPNGRWFTRIDLGAGSASVDVVDPIDGNLGDDPDEAIYLRVFGYRSPLPGNLRRIEADQRAELHLEAIREPLACLRNGQQNQEQPNWSDVFTYYQSNGTELAVNSLPSRAPATNLLSLNPSVTNNHNFWYDARLIVPALPAADDVERREDIGSPIHQACVRIRRGNRAAGAAHRLNGALLKPNSTYRVVVECYAPGGNTFKAFFAAVTSEGTLTGSEDVESISLVLAAQWRTLTFDITTPAWGSPPSTVYLVINSDRPLGTSGTFYLDNVDVYETGARFVYQNVLSSQRNQLYASAPLNASGIYWIDCAGQKIVIERSRILATLLLLNPGPGSQIAYGPYDWSPPAPGYPALLVNGDFTISGTLASDTQLHEEQNGVNFNPAGAPNTGGNTDNDNNDSYESQLRGLIGISGNLNYQYNPPIRGQVVGPTVPAPPASVVYTPESLLSPPPGFYNYRYERRPASMKKVVRH